MFTRENSHIVIDKDNKKIQFIKNDGSQSIVADITSTVTHPVFEEFEFKNDDYDFNKEYLDCLISENFNDVDRCEGCFKSICYTDETSQEEINKLLESKISTDDYGYTHYTNYTGDNCIIYYFDVLECIERNCNPDDDCTFSSHCLVVYDYDDFTSAIGMTECDPHKNYLVTSNFVGWDIKYTK